MSKYGLYEHFPYEVALPRRKNISTQSHINTNYRTNVTLAFHTPDIKILNFAIF
jgi:hypothetical protein